MATQPLAGCEEASVSSLILSLHKAPAQPVWSIPSNWLTWNPI